MNIWDERGGGSMLVQHVKCHRIGGSIGRSQRHVTSSPCDLKTAAALNNYFLTRPGI